MGFDAAHGCFRGGSLAAPWGLDFLGGWIFWGFLGLLVGLGWFACGALFRLFAYGVGLSLLS
ncbi:hypothetical protein P3T40_001389 [Paraburkholderia sp. EB58]